MEAVGALQAQYWPAPPAALWSRVEGFEPDAFYAALADGELVAGTLLRATLHLVSAREHPAYAAVAAEAAGHHWRRTDDEPGAAVEQLLTEAADLREPHAAQRRGDRRVRRGVGHRASQGALGRRARAPARAQVAPVPALVGLRAGAGRRRLGHEGAERPARGPAPARRAEGRQGARRGRAPPPAGVRAGGPRRRGGLDRLAHAAGARGAASASAGELERFEDEGGRALYDLPDAPRPDPETPAPPRLLAAFDSVLLAYAAKRRARILPDEHRDAVYERRNLQIRPSYLVDGLVAGTWSIEAKRREATLTLRPLERLARATRS